MAFTPPDSYTSPESLSGRLYASEFTPPDSNDLRFNADYDNIGDPGQARDEIERIISQVFGDIIDNWQLLIYGLQVWDIDSEDNQLPSELRDLILQLEYIVGNVATTQEGLILIGQAKKVFPGIDIIFREYASWKSKQLSTIETILSDDKRNFEERMADLFSRPGEERFAVATDFITTAQDTVTQIIRDNTRENVSPSITLPFELSVGLSKFAVPPLNIGLSSDYKVTSITGGAIRQPNSPKFNTGHSETYVNVTLYFPNEDSIWGYDGEGDFDIDFDNDPEEKIDYYMSSLRGLVTAFKFSPFLPVKNQFLNSTFDITGVGLQSMTVQSLEGFPFVLAVNLTLVKFNYKPFLPMIRDFNQAIHWGKYRQYCGAAARSLGSMVEKGFLVDDNRQYFDGVNINNVDPFTADDLMFDESGNAYQYDFDKAPSYQYNNLMSKINEGTFSDLRHFQLYYPKNIVSKLYAPDIQGFRNPYEDNLLSFDEGSTYWDRFVSSVAGIDIQQFVGEGDAPSYQDVVNTSKAYKADEGKMSDIEKIFTWLEGVETVQNDTATGALFQLYFDELIENASNSPGADLSEEAIASIRLDTQRDWLTVLMFQFQETPYIKDILNNMSGVKNDRFFKEWEVPMEKMELNWDDVHISGISLSMGNNIVRHQLQMQEDPVHQHIGGRDTQLNVSMIITGEDALISFRRVLSHISGLARLEHAKGVIGFLGIKNTITALCGVKYVLPLSFEVNTIPGYPHVYQVNMTLVDFDIFQQKREILNSDQQKQFIDMFGKRNPFLRLKQYWGASSNYPDMPLAIRNSEGSVVGYHDPDHYFRAFQTLDDDLVTFGEKPIVVDNSASTVNPVGGSSYKKAFTEADSPILPESSTEDDFFLSINSYPEFVELPVENELVVKTNLGSLNSDQSLQHMIDINGKTLSIYDYDAVSGETRTSVRDLTIKDDLAEDNLKSIQPGTVSFGNTQGSSVYNDPALNALGISSGFTSDDSSQYEALMADAQYRGTTGGRMLSAFPTYMLWLIDEGGTFAGTRLFDNFYGLNSVIDFSVVQSEDILGDTLVLRVSNMYQKLSREAQNFLSYDEESDSGFVVGIDNLRNQITNHWRHMLDDPPLYYQELNNIRLKPGVRLHLRAGYGSNPNSLDTIFNGVITEVQQGDIVTVIAQSDAIELSGMVNSENEDGHSGKIDGAMSTGFYLSEPRDLMVKLLMMGTSNFREQVSRATRGVIFSESKYGIRHFGSILYPALSEREEELQAQKLQGIAAASNFGKVDDLRSSGPKVYNGITALSGVADKSDPALSNNVLGKMFSRFGVPELMQVMWVNLFRSRDYEIFKRNIYPGNGTGIMQFAGIDTFDAASILRGVSKYRSETQSIGSGIKPNQSQIQSAYLRALAEADETILDKGYELEYLTQNNVVGENAAQSLNDLASESDNSSGSFWPSARAIFSIGNDILTNPWGVAKVFTDPLFDDDSFIGTALDVGLTIGSVLSPVGVQDVGSVFMGAFTAGTSHDLFDVFGITTELDDDLQGFDEISFRAQTYMRTVWDLCEICADMLPNYIVAVRPFEDRSTLFYGKPHWLYTSGVIPLTTGIPKSRNLTIEEPNEQLRQIQEYIAQQASPFADRKIQEGYTFGSGRGSEDPYAAEPGGYWEGGDVASLPLVASNGAQLPRLQRKVKAAIEMHLPTHGGTPTANDNHMQHPGLPDQYKYPRYMDRFGGARGGDETFTLEKNPDSVLGEDPGLRGEGGAFSNPANDVYLDPASEQYYIAARWPYSGLEDERVEGQTKEMFRHRRILVYNEDNGNMCVVTPGDYGPARDVSVDIGLSPDAMWWLSGKNSSKVQRLDNLWIGFVPDGTPLGVMLDGANQFKVGRQEFQGGYTQVPPGGVGEVIVEVEPKIMVGSVIDQKIEEFEQFLNHLDVGRIDWGSEAFQGLAEDEESFRSWAKDHYQGDIDAFINRFGWAFDGINPAQEDNAELGIYNHFWRSSLGGSAVGEETYALFNQGADDIYNSIGGANFSIEQAGEIWDEFRRYFRQDVKTVNTFLEIESNALAFVEAVDENSEVDLADVTTFPLYQQRVAEFMQFMWADPYRRAWLVVVTKGNITTGGTTVEALEFGADVVEVGSSRWGFVGDLVSNGVDLLVDEAGAAIDYVEGAPDYNFDPVLPVWKVFNELDEDSPQRTTYASGLGADGQEAEPRTLMDSVMQELASPASKTQSIINSTLNDVGDWYDRNIGSVLGEIGTLYSAVLTQYRVSMMQMDLNLNQVGQMQRQANIMNRVLNDSIYFDPQITDPILRLADNPFTREYGEPVIEVREPFQRIHYLSSFNNIISNNIFETTNDVNTVITASSDGKYPVTVYFDKGAPSHMQKEGSVESGLFWDNPRSSGFFSFLHPILNPIETYRGLYKEVTNSTDEMLSKRIAMSHLRKNLQDIYSGELTILGNASIRPHDLVYLSDVYEQMYGMFEVEEIVHHFTPDMGFVSTVKPNALVTVNDPGRWAYTSYMRSKFGVKDIRDTVRNVLDLKSDGLPDLNRSNFNLDNIHDTLEPIVMGATQFTAGTSALINDIQSKAYAGYLGYPQQAYDQLANVQVGDNALIDSGLAVLGFLGPFQSGGAIIGSAYGGDGYNAGLKNSIATWVPFVDFAFDAWDWVQENLKDQHSCYISYLNKNGQPMDAGLAYNQGVAVGQWYTKTTLPGLLVSTTRIRNPEGHVRITYDDLLESLGWNEIAIEGMVKRTSWFVDQTNAQILNLSGFGPDPVTVGSPLVVMARVIEVVDGDTIKFEYIAETATGTNVSPQLLSELDVGIDKEGYVKLRFAGINTPEMKYYNTNSDYEFSYIPPGEESLGQEANDYVVSKIPAGAVVAIRLDPSNLRDKFGRFLGVVFYSVPEGTTPENQVQVLYDLASQTPIVPWDSYYSDGRPYTLNWELVIKGYADVSLASVSSGIRDYRDSLNGIREG